MSELKIGINGFGRIGRMVFRAAAKRSDVTIVAINDLLDVEHLAYLLKYDSVHGNFDGTVEIENGNLVVNGAVVRITAERDPKVLQWDAVGADIVAECTGIFTTLDMAQAHIDGGAKKVVISAPSADAPMFVMGVNHTEAKASDNIVSNASCTTNCLAPLAKVINEKFGITNGLANTIHAYTNDQSLLDVYHSDLLRARAAGVSMIPTKTGAASAVGLVLPELNGKLDGLAIRVPVSNVSLLDFTFTSEKSFSIDELNEALEAAANNGLSGVLDINSIPLVSTDFGNDPHSSIYDKSHTRQVGNSTKILAWYDNEWGFSNRMLDVASYLNQNVSLKSLAA